MSNNNSAKSLRSVEGIDSLHIVLALNKADLERFCNSQKLTLKEGVKKENDRQWKYSIILADGGIVSVTYSTRHKNSKFEFGGMMNYNDNFIKLQLLCELVQYFSDREMKISRIDYAVDINIELGALLPSITGFVRKDSKSTAYFNLESKSKKKSERKMTLCIYDKGRQLKIFSTPLTRIELRVFNSEITRLGLSKMLSDSKAMMATADLIYATLQTRLRLKDATNSHQRYIITTDEVTILKEFIGYLHGGAIIKKKDIFKIQYSLTLSQKILNWMKSNNLTPNKVGKYVERRKLSICKRIGVDVKTFNKAISFYQSIP